MLVSERFEKILQMVNKTGSVRLTELVDQIGVSESTVRRDIHALHQMGKLQKIHGGATSLDMKFLSKENSLQERLKINPDEKESIARLAASLIDDCDTIFIDAGTTTGQMIQHLNSCNLLVVTNSLSHAQSLVRYGIKTIVLGGEVRPISEAIEGPFATNLLERFNFDKAFLGANGFSIGTGYTTPSPYEAQVKEIAKNRSKATYVLADRSKQNVVALTSFARLDEAVLITDELDPEFGSIPHLIARGKR